VLGRHGARAEREPDVDARRGAERGRLLQRVRHADEVATGVLPGHRVHADQDAQLRAALAANTDGGAASAGSRGRGERVVEVGGQRKEEGEA